MSIKTILISQPTPTNENSPYSSLIRKHKVKIDFRKFIHVEGLTAKEVRAQRVDFSKFHNVILTSRNSVDHFFRITEEMRFKVPDQTKYFCQSEAVAYYLQKYVVFLRLYVLFDEANASNMPSFSLIYAHQQKYEMQNARENIGEIAHCAVAVGELFGGLFRSPVESPFVNCGVFAVTCALFAGSDVLRLWHGDGRRRIFTYRECEICEIIPSVWWRRVPADHI